jgi:hypothetical protein
LKSQHQVATLAEVTPALVAMAAAQRAERQAPVAVPPVAAQSPHLVAKAEALQLLAAFWLAMGSSQPTAAAATQ